MQHIAVEKQNSVEGLVLCGCGDVFIDGEVGEEGLDLVPTHIPRVSQAMEDDELLDPSEISLLGAQGIMFGADDIPYLIDEPEIFFHAFPP